MFYRKENTRSWANFHNLVSKKENLFARMLFYALNYSLNFCLFSSRIILVLGKDLGT